MLSTGIDYFSCARQGREEFLLFVHHIAVASGSPSTGSGQAAAAPNAELLIPEAAMSIVKKHAGT